MDSASWIAAIFLRAAANTDADATFLNNYCVGEGITWEGQQVSDTALRAGKGGQVSRIVIHRGSEDPCAAASPCAA